MSIVATTTVGFVLVLVFFAARSTARERKESEISTRGVRVFWVLSALYLVFWVYVLFGAVLAPPGVAFVHLFGLMVGLFIGIALAVLGK